MDAGAENRKLFDWKRSGAYAWKARFPLAPAGRTVRASGAEPVAAQADPKKGGGSPA